MVLQDPGLTAAVAYSSVTLTATTGSAVFVVLTTLAHGRFADNGVLVVPGSPVTLAFVPFAAVPFDQALFAGSLTVEHLFQQRQ
jgi:hypothetical protein